MELISKKTGMRHKIFVCLSSLVLLAATGYASTVTNDDSGVRIVGRVTDGSILLDGSSSELTGMEAPFLIHQKDTQYPSASELVAMGRIDSIDLSTNTLTVEGQVAAISESTQLIDALPGTSHLLIAAANTKHHLNVGDQVAIAGDITGPGQAIARFVVLMTSPATPGTSLVYVRGVVEEIDPIGREISIGQLRLNLNVSGDLNNYDNILAGDIIEAVGYSIGSGKLAVTDFAPITPPEIESTETSTPQGIHGSGLKGIHGSGLKGIHGSGLKGIHGSGLKGIHGSGLKGIHGSGLKGIHGSGLKGIHGSGLKGIAPSESST